MRGDQLTPGNVIDWRGSPAAVQFVSIGRTVDVVVQVANNAPFRITYPLLTADELNAEWTEEDFAARLEADLDAEQFTLIET